MFEDREHAGGELAKRLGDWRDRDALVLGLARGGVEAAAPVARALGGKLDVLVVRKLGAPGHPELAIGALVGVEGVEPVLDREMCRRLGIGADRIEQIVSRERSELARRERVYRAGLGPIEVQGRCVVLIDDGVATGSSLLAGIRAVRAGGPSELVLAVPVCPPETARRLASQADHAVFLATPDHFRAVGQFYERFEQTTDARVLELLGRG